MTATTKKHNFFIIGLSLYLIGFSIVCYYTNWQTCLGVIIMMTANNMEQNYRRQENAVETFNMLFKTNDNSQYNKQRL